VCVGRGRGVRMGGGGGFVRPLADRVRLLSTLGNREVAFLAASCARA